jgi:hypothetical protein
VGWDDGADYLSETMARLEDQTVHPPSSVRLPLERADAASDALAAGHHVVVLTGP